MLKDIILKQNKISPLSQEWDLYDRVIFEFALWIDKTTKVDRFYIATFDMKHENEQHWRHEHQLFEFDEDYKILFQIDWCEGENEIINLRFHSLDDAMDIVEEYENEYM